MADIKVEKVNTSKSLSMGGMNFVIKDGSTISVTYEKNTHKFEEILEFLKKNNLKIIDIVTEDGDLEDVFIKLTNN